MATNSTNPAGEPPAASAVVQAAATTFGAGDLAALVAQLNVWGPQLETAVQQLRGAQMLLENELRQLATNGATELTKIIVAFKAELDGARRRES